MHRRASSWLSVLTLGVVAGLTACGSSAITPGAGLVRISGTPSPAGQASVVPTEAAGSSGASSTGIPRNLVIPPGPLESYELTPRQEAATIYAEAVLVASCMRDRGYTYPVPRYDDVAAFVGGMRALTDSRVYGLVNLGDAKKYGFSQPPFPPDYMPATHLSKAGQQALTGRLDVRQEEALPVAKRGCNDVAFTQLTGITTLGDTNVLDSTMGHQLAIQAFERAAATPAYFAVQQDWAGCMKNKGYDIADPTKPATSKAYREAVKYHDFGVSARADKAESALAVAAVRCASEVDLVRRHQAQVNQYEQELLEKNQLALDEQKKMLDSAVAKALSIVSDGSAAASSPSPAAE